MLISFTWETRKEPSFKWSSWAWLALFWYTEAHRAAWTGDRIPKEKLLNIVWDDAQNVMLHTLILIKSIAKDSRGLNNDFNFVNYCSRAHITFCDGCNTNLTTAYFDFNTIEAQLNVNTWYIFNTLFWHVQWCMTMAKIVTNKCIWRVISYAKCTLHHPILICLHRE